MKLEWMGEYRDIVEQLIKYCNVYAAVYKKEEFMGTDIRFPMHRYRLLNICWRMMICI